MENQIEFKSKFKPELLKGGSMKVKHKDGSKHYVAAIIQGRAIVHESNQQFKTASETIAYANAVIARYSRLWSRAKMIFILNIGAVKGELIKVGES